MKGIMQWMADALLVAEALPDPVPVVDSTRGEVLYVIPERYRADLLAVRQVLQKQGVEDAEIWSLPPRRRGGNRFDARVENCLADDRPLQIIPVSVFWGRRPAREDSLWRTVFSDSWALPGLVRRFITVLTQRGNIQCYFSSALSLQELAQASEPGDDLTKKLRRILREHFRRQREAVVGPDLSHRRSLQFQVLNTPQVQDAIARETRGEARARKYLNEIASDYSYAVVRLFDILLNWLWKKLYSGVSLHGMQRVNDIATDHELVYVPCHRSHIDYLLLSYVIYHQGLMPPHIAAGINLNMPVIGPLLRRAGAFFIRREFRDNQLYRAVLEAYLATMCQKGFPIEYFIEGGRSRSGRLLQPKAGMLVMTLNSIRRNQSRPLAFVPVYIGYERIVESHSYIREMYGESKKTESVGGLFAARRYLRENFGQVHVQFGQPIPEREIWRHTDYRGPGLPQRESEEFKAGISWLSRAIMTGINDNVVIAPINLVATLLLATPQHAILENQMPQYLQALRRIALAGDSTTVQHGGEDWGQAISEVEQLGLFQRNAHTMGAILLLDQRGAMAATYLRNNTLHCFILPGIIASVLICRGKVSERRLRTLCLRLYPFLDSELFLGWSESGTLDRVSRILQAFVAMELVTVADGYYRAAESASEGYQLLSMVAAISSGTKERYYIVLHLLHSREAGYYSAQTLQDDCVLMAQRLSLLYSFHAPDFFDRNLFRVYIEGLLANAYLQQDGDGNLVAGRQIAIAERGFVYLLSPEVRRAILQITRQ